MNYEMFHSYSKVFRYDEVRIIGKDLCVDGEWIHIVGMTRKEEQAYLCILEQQPALEVHPVWKKDATNRESMLESAEEPEACALHINRIMIGENTFELQGGTGGNIAQQAEQAQAYLFFGQMLENGWSIPEESYFYQLDWNCIGLVELRLVNTYEKLPELIGEIRQLILGPSVRRHIIQMPVRLEQGKNNQLHFTIEEAGEEIICYINQVRMIEPLVEEQSRFEDAQYREKALQHVTESEFEKMRDTLLEALEADCPRGMGYFTVEYECTKENFSAQFYAAADLECIPKPKQGGTSMLMMGGNSTGQEMGPHGYRSRCRVIPYAVPVDTNALDAELFMMIEMIPEKVVVF